MVAPVVREIDMAAPAALATDTFLTDPQLAGLTFETLSTDNRLVDITNFADPAAGLTYILKMLRGGREIRRWAAAQLLTTVNVHPGFPIDTMPGSIQWAGQQIAGALTAQKYLPTWFMDL
jgi:hypothetical protein